MQFALFWLASYSTVLLFLYHLIPSPTRVVYAHEALAAYDRRTYYRALFTISLVFSLPLANALLALPEPPLRLPPYRSGLSALPILPSPPILPLPSIQHHGCWDYVYPVSRTPLLLKRHLNDY